MQARWRRLPLYVGGLMGPFGTNLPVPMVPELRDHFDASTGAIGWTMTVYLLPFAALLLVSGTLGERWGRRRTSRATFLLFGVASVGCAMAPTLGWFLVGRALQGALNAFFTPLLLASLASATRPEELGRAVGIFASFQSLGGVLAPVVAGRSADVDWRIAFAVLAVVAALVSVFPPEGAPRRDAASPPIRPLFTAPVWLLGLTFLAGAAGPIGVSVIVGLTARDDIGLTGSASGLLLMTGPALAMMLGTSWGRVLDRLGARRMTVVILLVCGAATATIAAIHSLWWLVVVWAITGLTSQLAVIGVQSLAAEVVPENRGGAISFVLAHRFLGHAVCAAIWVTVFASSSVAAYLGAASLTIVAVGALMMGAGRSAGTEPASTSADG